MPWCIYCEEESKASQGQFNEGGDFICFRCQEEGADSPRGGSEEDSEEEDSE